MLKAMKEQLLVIAKTNSKEFHSELKKRVGKRATAVLEEHLKAAIIVMPDLVTRVYFYWNRSQTQSRTKKMGGYLLTYLYEPEDFLSNEKWGLFGYLDDAYLVAKIYIAVISEELGAGRKVQPIDLSFFQEAQYLNNYVRGIIPEETKKIDEMIAGILKGDDRVFLQAFSR